MTRNTDYAALCERCYLTHCVTQSKRLEMYCPEYQAKKRNIEPAAMLAIVKGIPTNRKWDFILKVRDYATTNTE